MADNKNKDSKETDKKEIQRSAKTVPISECKVNCEATRLRATVVDDIVDSAKPYFAGNKTISRQATVGNLKDVVADKLEFYQTQLLNRGCHQSGLLVNLRRATMDAPLESALVLLQDWDVDKHGPLSLEELQVALGRE